MPYIPTQPNSPYPSKFSSLVQVNSQDALPLWSRTGVRTKDQSRQVVLRTEGVRGERLPAMTTQFISPRGNLHEADVKAEQSEPTSYPCKGGEEWLHTMSVKDFFQREVRKSEDVAKVTAVAIKSVGCKRDENAAGTKLPKPARSQRYLCMFGVHEESRRAPLETLEPERDNAVQRSLLKGFGHGAEANVSYETRKAPIDMERWQGAD
ncbi:hypothetical protein FA13DRAFT_1771160 [Coprinellus micaceus]|uniref:Uncharacterized protein n=1 Tax=Coprinellus micaceus TaxID=71717 RepID=A0A4Y7TQV9_COPMI|nr:hypothetical protein FA13DRAFT_1771160 [Coprinellus micaceus]